MNHIIPLFFYGHVCLGRSTWLLDYIEAVLLAFCSSSFLKLPSLDMIGSLEHRVWPSSSSFYFCAILDCDGGCFSALYEVSKFLWMCQMDIRVLCKYRCVLTNQYQTIYPLLTISSNVCTMAQLLIHTWGFICVCVCVYWC